MNTRSLPFRLVAWYALWLSVVFVIASTLVYFGLRRYLEHSLATEQTQRAKRIATLALQATLTNENSLSSDITARFAPEASERFIRVVRSDGKVLYQSRPPHDRSFDPAQISAPARQIGIRREKLPSGPELVLATVAAGPANAPRLFIETGESLAPALDELRRLLTLPALGFIIVTGVALAGGYQLIHRALHSVEEITKSAERITSSNLSERLPIASTGDELERLATALNHMITRLDEAFQYSRRFVADASHELRTPLTVMQGELEEIIQREALPGAVRERLGSVLEEVERLAHIVEGLFALSRLDAGEAQREWVRFDLATLAANTAAQMNLLAEDKNISLECAKLDEVYVEGDRARLKQIVVNLLDNSIKYTPEGGAITLRVTAQAHEGLLEVADTGIGIPAEALPHVFERFFRVDKARSRELGGAGLGLSIVKSICTAHSGRVDVESVVGRGSRVRVFFPLADGTKNNKVKPSWQMKSPNPA
jgi:heavy metal sensor kinase